MKKVQSHVYSIVTMPVAEIIQSILLKGKNGRIYSQLKSAVLARNYLNLNPKAREACNVRKQIFRAKRRALERALLETQHSSILAGAFFFFLSHRSKMGNMHQKGMAEVLFCRKQQMPFRVVDIGRNTQNFTRSINQM